MKCPQCNGILVTLEFDRVEIDYCPTCEGIWLDSGELRILLSKEGEGDSLLKTMVPIRSKEKKRRCPICSKGMGKILIGEEGSVELDECLEHGLWFDRGELGKALEAGCAVSPGNVRTSSLMRLLDEVFASCKE